MPQCPINHKAPPLPCVRWYIVNALLRAVFASSVSARAIQSDNKPDTDNALTIDAAKRRRGALRIFSKRLANKRPIAGLRGIIVRAVVCPFRNAVQAKV